MVQQVLQQPFRVRRGSLIRTGPEAAPFGHGALALFPGRPEVGLANWRAMAGDAVRALPPGIREHLRSARRLECPANGGGDRSWLTETGVPE